MNLDFLMCIWNIHNIYVKWWSDCCPCSSSPNHWADSDSDEGSALLLADADNRQKQWKQMSGRNGGIRKVDTTILFSPLVHYVASSQDRNKVKTKLWQFREGETMISIYNYVNDDILAKREWHKINLILMAIQRYSGSPAALLFHGSRILIGGNVVWSGDRSSFIRD